MPISKKKVGCSRKRRILALQAAAVIALVSCMAAPFVMAAVHNEVSVFGFKRSTSIASYEPFAIGLEGTLVNGSPLTKFAYPGSVQAGDGWASFCASLKPGSDGAARVEIPAIDSTVDIRIYSDLGRGLEDITESGCVAVSRMYDLNMRVYPSGRLISSCADVEALHCGSSSPAFAMPSGAKVSLFMAQAAIDFNCLGLDPSIGHEFIFNVTYSLDILGGA